MIEVRGFQHWGDTTLAERPIEQLTLRELFTNAELLIRELSEHLQQSFQPTLRALEQVVGSYAERETRHSILDSSVRSQVASLLNSDDYSQKLFSRLNELLSAIDERSLRAITES